MSKNQKIVIGATVFLVVVLAGLSFDNNGDITATFNAQIVKNKSFVAY